MIREANPDDAEGICTVLRESITKLCSSDHGNDPVKMGSWLENKTTENCRLWLGSAASKTFVAVKLAAVVGVIMVSHDGYIYLCYVKPDVKGQGFGSQMLIAAEAWLKSIGCNSLMADSTATAHGFYKHHGYVACGEPELEEGMLSYPLKKTLIYNHSS